MRIDLGDRYNGNDIIRTVIYILSKEGGELDYLPIRISYSNAPSLDKRIYRNITLKFDRSELDILNEEQEPELRSDREYEHLEVQVRGDETDHINSFLDKFRELIGTVGEEEFEELKGEQTEERETYSVPSHTDYGGRYRLLVVFQDHYGQRILDHVKEQAPPHWEVESLNLPPGLPQLIDDPAPYLPEDFPEVDAVLFLSESPNAPQLAADIVKRCRARGLIAPVDNGEWMPPGQIYQLKKRLDQWGAEYSFPRPFCSLEEEDKPAVDEFAREFGRPSVEIRTEDEETVTEVIVRRGSPCGCTDFVADNLEGEPLEEAVEKAGLYHHHYPCLASMEREKDLDDTLMHVSGFITKSMVEEQIKKYIKKEVSYIDPEQFRR